MNVLVVYESMYGNTHAVADAIAEGVRQAGGEATVQPLSAGRPDGNVELLVVGGPTHMHGLTTQMSRRMAAQAAKEDEDALDPAASEDEGLRAWLRHLEDVHGAAAAAFDTRGDAKAALTGSAARGIARRLRHRGYEIAGRESFLVADAEGPLADGELDRARSWGAELAARPA